MKILLSLFCLLILVSCSPEPKEVSSDQLVVRQGIVYEVNSTTPFTGSDVSYYHDNGQLKGKGNFIDGKEDGFHESYHENGQLQIKGNYQDGERDGIWEGFEENGQIEFTSYYINGKKVKRKKYLRRK